MIYTSVRGYPTPPASPCYDSSKLTTTHLLPPLAINTACPTGYAPVAPQERLGKFLGDSTIQFIKVIGTGAYGVVYLAYDVKTTQLYAVKTLSKYNADGSPLDPRQMAFLHRELRLHYQASRHPNVVSMHKIVDFPDCIYVLLEYCAEGDLFFNITECGQYVGKDDLVRSVFLQILDAVEYCHELNIYHRDLKPENILVTNQGETVKLADFGLAIATDRSNDYGCGSTFYMSPECLDPPSRTPYYMCAPNDVWSLGVILVNLTCGRNPWRQASFEDSTYRAFSKDRDFLRTILPLSDDLNDILGRIFTRDPEQRIKLPELRKRIVDCSNFTIPATPDVILPQPVSPETQDYYVDCEDAASEDVGYDAPLSPPLSDSDGESTCSSDEGSLTFSHCAIDDLDEDEIPDLQEEENPVQEPQMFDPEEPKMVFPQEFVPQQTGPIPGTYQACEPCADPVLAQPSCPQNKFMYSYFWDMMNRYATPPQFHQPGPFHQQFPLLANLQGFY